MKVNDLPLMELFEKLQDAGLPLGIGEYEALLRALQAGFGIPDREALARLCCTLWVKSQEEKHIFDKYFEEFIPTSKASDNFDNFTKINEGDSNKNNSWSRFIYWFIGLVFIIGSGIIISNLITPPKPIDAPKPNPSIPPGEIIPKPTPKPTPNNADSNPVFFWDNWPVILTIGGGYLLTLGVFRNIIESRNRPQEKLFKPVVMIPGVDEVQIAKTVRQSSRKTKPGFSDRIVITTGYSPVTRRQMKQSWRYLRGLVREGAKTELDIEATVNQIGRQGLLLEPVFISPRVNRTELLLLIDQGGSMIPFHRLSHRLTETALQAGHWGKTTIYYFHNCPVDYLYHDRDQLEAELISRILSQLAVQWTVVLMFSDGGAARGGLNPQRIELTKAFLGQLKQQVRAMAWLNPMPCNRWNGTTAGEIRALVPMFEFSREGLQNAINVLRIR
ncbi:hypothetical protein [Moorena bouillonii]|uniref:VWA containing CoxE family protein n=1 Tax=Moorena bouillonii PNG TaxID=568701 RepID=A0A1U7N3C2_9CYAN|nr:hypothetical protein [Moorena bouillonii]OLT60414.1 hypothetical protein BJP37_16695 [Moorena bouillonii PNG]